MIIGGYMGKILRVDLTSGSIGEEKLNESLLKTLGGQIGIGLKIMYDEVPGDIDATDPRNRLIFMTGPFTGTRVQSPANFQVISKNPITGCHFAVGNSHGFWGPRLKFAGYDGIVIQGRANRPVYLLVSNEQCEIRDASRIWGKTDCFETEDIIKKELGQEKVSVAAIGPAGERLCASAMVENEHGHVAAKGNIGMVMGSKYLKAVAVCGTGRVPVAKATEFNRLAKEWRNQSFETPMGAGINALGTAGGVPTIHALGDLPTKNFTTGVFPTYNKLSGRYLRETFTLKRKPCYGCSLTHIHNVTVTQGPYTGFVGEEPEYEDLSNLGSLIGLDDPGAVVWLTDYVDRLGLDGNWAGSITSWAMEAYEKGILNKDVLGGLELRWGDEKAAAELLRRIAYREGIGDVLALGLKKGPEAIGGEKAAAFAAHFKGEANHAHDSRALWGQFLGLCISGAGPRWESPGLDRGPDIELGYPTAQDRFGIEGKAEAARKTQLKKLFNDTLGVCMFGIVSMDMTLKAYAALTGWHLGVDEAYMIGERIANLQRAFNLRHGFKPEIDLDVSPRLLEAPPDGGAEGKTIAPYLKDMVMEYNKMMDWDWDTGRPSRTKLDQLGLNYVATDLWK
ncbi:aldehyde ferredoxin oxidoreductase family protein [Chloroflexota bacterium]